MQSSDKDLSNDFFKSTNNYPVDLVAAQTLLLNYKGAEAAPATKQLLTMEKFMFAQQARDKAAAATNYQQKDLSEMTDNACNGKGHYQRSPACSVHISILPIEKHTRIEDHQSPTGIHEWY